MIVYYRMVRHLASIVGDAVNLTTEALKQGRVEQEAAFTDRMLGGIEHAVDDRRIGAIKWHAKTLTDRGPGSQESTYGADFMGVFSVNLTEIKLSKGFL